MSPVCVIGAGVSGLSIASLLTKQGFDVIVYEKSNNVGGRTSSIKFKGHILDNGFHIMPFYKKSAIYEILQTLGIQNHLKLSKIDKIDFFSDKKFHKYPKGILDLLSLSLIPFKSRLALLKILLPMAFSSIEQSEKHDDVSLLDSMESLDEKSRSFFDAVCMLAFADTPDHISLGEFERTIMRANPFKGGTSEFAYPSQGGYDSICTLLAKYVKDRGGKIELSNSISKVVVEDGKTIGIIDQKGKFVNTNCVVVSYPAYLALNTIFEERVFPKYFIEKINQLNKTTAVIEVHFGLDKKLDTRHVVFPVGKYVTKGVFFISNITRAVSPPGEHLMIAGTPVSASDADNTTKIKQVVGEMKKEINQIYPAFENSVIWERPMAWKLVESIVKEPGKVWKNKMPHTTEYVDGLFFVGDSTVSYGIGTDSAAHSAILCLPKMINYLENSKISNLCTN